MRGRSSQRQRGAIDTLPSGALRVRVYAGIDPLTGRRHNLIEVIPPGPNAAREAEKARTRLLSQVDEQRNPRTRTDVSHLLDRWLEMLDVEPSTRRGYTFMIEKHIRPLLGRVQVARVDAELLETLYARLRKCRHHCNGRRFVGHRTSRQHGCDARCKLHVCRGLSATSVRQVHWILSGAFDKAVRWKWIAINPAEQADKPALPHPDPRPPSVADASRIVTAAWRDPDWGTFVWCAMTLGARRGELCALRWKNVDLANKVVSLRQAIAVGPDGELVERSTKTHQQRRVVLDEETVRVLADHRRLWQERVDALGLALSPDAFVFSTAPDGSTFPLPDTMTRRYDRLVKRLGIDSHLHTLRHYSATELIAAGTDIRTVAGRLGHGGGGATTLRVYAAWLSEADQRAASALSGRMPSRPSAPAHPAVGVGGPAAASPAGATSRAGISARVVERSGAGRRGTDRCGDRSRRRGRSQRRAALATGMVVERLNRHQSKRTRRWLTVVQFRPWPAHAIGVAGLGGVHRLDEIRRVMRHHREGIWPRGRALRRIATIWLTRRGAAGKGSCTVDAASLSATATKAAVSCAGIVGRKLLGARQRDRIATEAAAILVAGNTERFVEHLAPPQLRMFQDFVKSLQFDHLVRQAMILSLAASAEETRTALRAQIRHGLRHRGFPDADTLQATDVLDDRFQGVSGRMRPGIA